MQREFPKYAKDKLMGKMPFQEKYKDFIPVGQIEGFAQTGALSTGLDAAKAAFPIFGGAEDDDDKPESPPETVKAASASKAPGGDSAPKEAEVPNLEAMTPEKIAELLKNVGDLTNQVTKLTVENNTFKSKEQQTERAKMGREQQLEADLTDAQQTIAKMDAVIRHAAVINAIQGMKDMEWHSARHVMNELDSSSFDLDVDLDNGTATVTGIEGELKRIAKECPWLVSKDRTRQPDNSQTHRQPRASGSPPAPPGGANDKVTKRAELINKYPVIAHGRTG